MLSVSPEVFVSASQYSRPVDLKKLRFVYHEIDRHNQFRPVERILEIGCGDGGITRALTALGLPVDACDINPTAVASLQALNLPCLTLSVQDGLRIDTGRTYDVIIASEVFEHVPTPEVLARNVAALLHSGGLLITTIPNGWGPYELQNRRLNPFAYMRRWNWLRGHFGRDRYVWGAGPDHAQFFTRSQYLRLLSEHGFTLLESSNSDALLTVLGPRARYNSALNTFDMTLADRLPSWLSSGWYFAHQRD